MRRRYPVYVVKGRKIVGWRMLITTEEIDIDDIARRALDTFLDPLYAPAMPEGWDAVEVWAGGAMRTLPRESEE